MTATLKAGCEQGHLLCVCVRVCVCLTALSHVVWCVCWPQYLACLKTSRSQTDKLSFDVGLQEDSTGKRKALAHLAFILLLFSPLFPPRCLLPLFLCLVLSVCLSPSLSLSLSLSPPPPPPLSASYLFMIEYHCVDSASRLIFPVELCRHTVCFFCQCWLHLCSSLDSPIQYHDTWKLLLIPIIIIYFMPNGKCAVMSIRLKSIVATVLVLISASLPYDSLRSLFILNKETAYIHVCVFVCHQVRPAGGPSTLRPNRDRKERRCASVMISSSSACPQSDTL